MRSKINLLIIIALCIILSLATKNVWAHFGMNSKQNLPPTLRAGSPPIADTANINNLIFIETEIDRHDPYIQGVVQYSIRVYIRAGLVVEGSVSEPQLDNALIQNVGEDRHYNLERNGQMYWVAERQYTISPQTSGKLVLPVPVLDARVSEEPARRRGPSMHMHGSFSNRPTPAITRSISVHGESTTLTVHARPAAANNAYWLPAEHVKLSEDWQSKSDITHVGDPVTRIVTIRARGAIGEQLPDLDPGNVEGFKVYTDHPKINTHHLEKYIEGEKSQSFAFVPTHPGRFILPAVNLHWWDTHNDRAQMVQIPEREVTVLAATNTQDNFASEHSFLTQQIKYGATTIPMQASSLWPWMSSIFFAILWLGTLWMWWYSKRHPLALPREIVSSSVNLDSTKFNNAKKNFQAACLANNPQQARRKLLEWAATHWTDNPPAGLDDLASRFVDPEIRNALAELDRSLYLDNHDKWDGRILASIITKFPQSGHNLYKKTPLPKLYA